MSIPEWWEALLLGAAAWRTFQLIAFDDLLERPRRYVTRLPREWKEGRTIPPAYRENLAKFIQCPYCLGAWVALGWWSAWQIEDEWTLILSVPFMLSTVLVAVHKFLASD